MNSDGSIEYVHDEQSRRDTEYLRWFIRKRKKDSAAEFRRRCEECKRLALDATPMTAGERERVERELSRGKQNA